MKQAHALPLLMVLSLMLWPGCRPEPGTPGQPVRVADDAYRQDPGKRDTVLAALRSIKQEAMLDAFAALPRYRYTRYTRTDQFDETYRRIGFTERITRNDLRQDARTRSILQADSAGVFDFGYLDRFVPAGVREREASNLPQHVLLEDPAYLAPRNRNAFFYRFLPDTVLWDSAVQGIEVRARPGVGDAQPLRRIRLYIDRSRGALIALSLERREQGLLFREESRFYLQIRPAPDGGWVPYHTDFFVRLRIPLRAPQRFRTASTYYDYSPPG